MAENRTIEKKPRGKESEKKSKHYVTFRDGSFLVFTLPGSLFFLSSHCAITLRLGRCP